MSSTDVDEDADEDDIPVIHLPMVKGAVLKRVTEFLQHHSDDPLPTIPKVLQNYYLQTMLVLIVYIMLLAFIFHEVFRNYPAMVCNFC